jgi:5'-nucleotidase (lipoprotein e(P4) family)
MRRLSIVLLLAGAAACAQRSAAPVAPRPPAAAPAAAVPAPAALPDAIRWVQQSAEFQAVARQVYRLATAHVEAAAVSRKPATWAVVLDADETVISNATYQAERARIGAGFTAETWNAWVRRREATPLPGAAEFLARVRALGGRIAIVTNRLQSECADTEAVFTAHGLAYDAMLCRPDGSPSDKNPRFRAVAEGRSATGSAPLDVVAFVGDNILDFPALTQAMRSGPPSAFAEFGARYYLVPNPMYGSWQ